MAFWVLVVGAIGLLMNGVIIFLTVKYNRRNTRLAEEQLRLAREQAAKVPDLMVTDVRLVEVTEVDEVWSRVQEVENEREAEVQQQRTYERELRKLEGNGSTWRSLERFERQEVERNFAPQPNLFRYEGPIPNKVLLLDITNQGGSTAFEIAGGVYLDAAYLEPLGYFSSGGGELSLSIQDGVYRIEVGEAKNIMITPYSSYSFVIAVKTVATGTTTVGYDLSSPTGSPATNSLALEILN